MTLAATFRIAALLSLTLLPACGGGGVNSTPTPVSSSSAPPSTTIPAAASTPPVNYDTAEYRRSNAAVEAGALTAYNAGASGAGVTVAVVDSGLSDPGGALAGRISAASADLAGSRGIADGSGHGTEVSMLIAAARDDSKIMGIAWQSTVLALRTDTPGTCATECRHDDIALATAIDVAAANQARVVNISLGGSAAGQVLRNAVYRATNAGVIVVISAGNDADGSPDALATSLANVGNGLVIIAMAVDANGTAASFSNRAAGYETSTLGALGVGTATIDATGSLTYVSGTSFSAPAITAAVALIAQAFPNLSSAQIVALLKSTATDAGASGLDSIYGNGLLNLAAAFAPQGQTSLAATSTMVSASAISSLSAPMGDASATSAGVKGVVTDALGRAYQMDIGGRLSRPAPTAALLGAVGPGVRALDAVLGDGRALSLSVAASGTNTASPRIPDAAADAPTGRVLAARMASRLGAGTRVAFGFSATAEALAPFLGDRQEAPFIAATGRALPGNAFRGDRAALVRQAVAPGLDLSMMSETGRVAASDETRRGGRDSGYARFGFGLDARRGIASLAAGIERLTEDGSTLGARLAPQFGAASAATDFVHARLDLDLGRWTLGGEARRGWTRAAAGGALLEGGRLTSESWSIAVTRRAVTGQADTLALRIAQPLRVTASDFALTLPVAYDYATGAAATARRPLDLTPRGRELDAELVWTGPVGDGWLSANFYARREPGNVAAAPDDLGGAVRFRLAF